MSLWCETARLMPRPEVHLHESECGQLRSENTIVRSQFEYSDRSIGTAAALTLVLLHTVHSRAFSALFNKLTVSATVGCWPPREPGPV